MLLMCLTLGVAGLSLVMIWRNFRSMATDTLHSLRESAANVFVQGRVLSNAAFGLLWMMIFGLCFA